MLRLEEVRRTIKGLKIFGIMVIGGIITWQLDPYYPVGVAIMFVAGWMIGSVMDDEL